MDEEIFSIARRISGDLAEFTRPRIEGADDDATAAGVLLDSTDALLAEYDRRILDPELREATRTRFVTKHYADAVESGIKALNECVRQKSGRTEDGDDLMNFVFSRSLTHFPGHLF